MKTNAIRSARRWLRLGIRAVWAAGLLAAAMLGQAQVPTRAADAAAPPAQSGWA